MGLSKRKACKYKKFRTAEEAYGYARRTRGKANLRAYKCSFCRGYHLAADKEARLKAAFEAIEKEREERKR